MTIYYSPEYTGFIYTGLNDGQVHFDTQYVNTAGLCSLLRLHAGLPDVNDQGLNRPAKYYGLLKHHFEAHQHDSLAESFATDGFGTAIECLKWRDLLVESDWDATKPQPSARLKLLAALEPEFKGFPSFGERIKELTESVKNGCSLPKDLKIITPNEINYLRPIELNLLEALRSRGVEIKRIEAASEKGNNLAKVRSLMAGKDLDGTLSDKEKDESFRILKFKTKRDAINYLTISTEPSQYDVWIIPDNKVYDNYQSLAGRPTSGSVAIGGMPQMSQMLMLGISLFQQPLNVNTLLDWLYLPISPISARIRYKIASAITSSGGYYNDTVRDIINKIEDKDDKKDIITFLPSTDVPKDLESTSESKEKIQSFIKNLANWCNGMAASKYDDEVIKGQLRQVSSQAEIILMLLEEEEKDSIEISTITGWLATIYSTTDMSLYNAEVGGRCVIGNVSGFAAISPRTIICDFVGNDTSSSTYSFLTKAEKDFLGKSIWSDTDEHLHRLEASNMPFLFSDAVTVVYYEYNAGEKMGDNPLLIMLKQKFKDLSPITLTPELDETTYKDRTAVDNQIGANQFVEFSHPELIKWPASQSPTSLSKLISYPFDYMIEDIAGITGSGLDSMRDIKRTSGDVAHEVFATMFGHGEFDINKYNQVFNEAVLKKGQILLLNENKVHLAGLQIEIKRCLVVLNDIIKENGLKVKECERRIFDEGGLTKDTSLAGFIDMNLEDEKGNEFIFDFKWTSSKSYYNGLLATNTSSQLALYSKMVKDKDGQPVTAVAYFLMPAAKLYSTYEFKGPKSNVILVEVDGPNADKDIFTQIQNSYLYRKDQLSKGKIEQAEGLSIDLINYASEAESKNLFPLPSEGNDNDGYVKSPNKFSNIQLFKK